jgi:multidrug resistance efflux pump
VVSRQMRDDAESRYRMAKAATAAADRAVAAAEGRLREAKAIQKRTEHGFRPEEIAAARADVTAAEGEVQQAEAQWVEREVKSPADATVEALDIRPGDLLPANAPVAKLLEVDQMYCMVYVPEPQLGRVRLGQRASISSDAFPGESFEGIVEQIRQKAEFLPRNVQTSDERQHQMIGVKVRVKNPQGRLRAGVHADVKFEVAK